MEYYITLSSTERTQVLKHYDVYFQLFIETSNVSDTKDLERYVKWIPLEDVFIYMSFVSVKNVYTVDAKTKLNIQTTIDRLSETIDTYFHSSEDRHSLANTKNSFLNAIRGYFNKMMKLNTSGNSTIQIEFDQWFAALATRIENIHKR